MRRPTGGRRGPWLCVATLLLAGCYGYVPAEPGVLRPQEEVRLHLTREGTLDLPDFPRLSGATVGGATVSGRFVANDGDRILLRVPIAEQIDGALSRTVRQEVPIDASQVLQVERRRLDRFRTGLAVAGALFGAAAIVTGFGALDVLSPEEPPPPIDEEAGVGRSILLRFSLPVP